MLGLASEPPPAESTIGLLKIPIRRPAVGTYVIGPYLGSSLYGELVLKSPQGGTEFYLSQAGQLTITSSSAQSLAGSQSFSPCRNPAPVPSR